MGCGWLDFAQSRGLFLCLSLSHWASSAQSIPPQNSDSPGFPFSSNDVIISHGPTSEGPVSQPYPPPIHWFSSNRVCSYDMLTNVTTPKTCRYGASFHAEGSVLLSSRIYCWPVSVLLVYAQGTWHTGRSAQTNSRRGNVAFGTERVGSWRHGLKTGGAEVGGRREIWYLWGGKSCFS